MNSNSRKKLSFQQEQRFTSHLFFSSLFFGSIPCHINTFDHKKHNCSDSHLAKPRVSYNNAQRSFNIHHIHRGMTSFCFGQILRLNRMFLPIGKSLIPSRILQVYGLDEIYQVSSSTFCVKICGKIF